MNSTTRPNAAQLAALRDYSAPAIRWEVKLGEYDDESTPGADVARWAILENGWRVLIGRYGAVLREEPLSDQRESVYIPRVACCRCGQVTLKSDAREVTLTSLPEGHVNGWECGCLTKVALMNSTHTPQNYGRMAGFFEDVAVEDMQGGDIIPSYDGLYHLYEGHVENEDGTITVNFSRCRSISGSGAEPYSVEFEPGHQIPILVS